MDFLKEILGEELFNQVAEKLKDNDKVRIVNGADGSWIPKDKFDNERETVKTLKKQIADLNTSISDMQAKATDADTIKGQLSQLQADMAKKDEQMKALALGYKVKDAVRAAKAKNADIVMKMIDTGKITEDGDNLLGLSDQIEALKKSDGYLFEGTPAPSGGVDPHTGGNNPNPASENYTMNNAIRAMAGYT